MWSFWQKWYPSISKWRLRVVHLLHNSKKELDSFVDPFKKIQIKKIYLNCLTTFKSSPYEPSIAKDAEKQNDQN